MPNLLDMFGANPTTGLGPVVSAMNAQEDQDTNQAKSLSDLYTAQLNQQALGLKNTEDQQTSATRVQAQNAQNLGTVTAQNVQSYQKAGELLGQLSDSMSGVPVGQRQAVLSKIVSQIPGASDNPVVQGLLSSDPNNLPTALKSLGNDIALKSSDYLKKSGIQGQSDTAALQRVNAQEAGANARNAASIASAQSIAAARDANALKVARASHDPSMLKENLDQAIARYTVLANRPDLSPEQRQQAANIAKQLQESKVDIATAGAYPKFGLDASGNVIQTNPYGRQGGQPNNSAGPSVGTVDGGYKFKGGNPADPNSWEKM